ncbi:MAG: ankyrin repeat domain-containing protein, partial [Candidatus Helarchaeota archaeon]
SAGHVEIVKLLLEKGAKIDIKSITHGLTALMVAADQGHTEVVKILLEKGANKDLRSLGLRTAYDYARLKGFSDIEELLKPQGKPFPLIKKRKKVTKKEAKNANKQLIAAIWSGDIEKVAEAIENGADVNGYKDDRPIIIAARNGEAEIVRLLIQQGADVNAKDAIDLTALVPACGGCYRDVVRILLENGAEVTDDVWIAVSVHKPPEIIKMLKAAPRKIVVKKIIGESKELIEAARNGDLKAVKTALKKGEDVNKKNYNNETALIKAAYHGHLDVVEFLIKKGADVKLQDSRGNTALLHAAWSGHFSVVKFLIENHKDLLKIRNNLGWTALMQASLEGHTEVAKIVIKNGDEVNAIEKEKGATPLILATYGGHIQIVKLLLENGADPKIGDKEGRMPLDYAREKGYSDIERLLSN